MKFLSFVLAVACLEAIAALPAAHVDLREEGKSRLAALAEFDGKPALGYDGPETFQVPEELKNRVDFWKRIYSEVSTSQAVIHDAQQLHIIYDVVSKEEAERRTEEIQAQLIENDREDDARRVRSQTGQSDRIVRGFLFGGRYFSHLMKVFRERNLPTEISRLPLVESGFDLDARSKVGASGPWQFMPSTGRLFMQIDRAIDERYDPEIAAEAAAEFLKQNYETLGSWPLAITAYNHGRGGMRRAVRETETRDLADIIEKYDGPAFGFASSNFYASFLAILEIERDHRKHFGELKVDAPVKYDRFKLAAKRKIASVAKSCGVRVNVLSELNPALTDHVLSGRGSIPRGFALKIPEGASCKKVAASNRREYRRKVRLSVRQGTKRKRQRRL